MVAEDLPLTSLSAILPVIDEAHALPRLLAALAGQVDEIVVVDGGSRDASLALARAAGARTLVAPAGRGGQLQAGAMAARGDLLWFLHADTRVPPGAAAALRSAATCASWGCFEVRISSPDPRLQLTAWLMNRRARRTGSCTGDMGIWCGRSFFDAIGGFSSLPVLEDLDFSDRARRSQEAAVLRPALETSARRWEQHGVGRTMLRLWGMRAAYRLGVAPERLARHYRRPAR